MVKGIEIHILDECICGQVHETIYHLSEGGTNVHFQYPKFEPVREVTKEFSPHVEFKPEIEIDLSGKCKEVKIEGIEWMKNRGFVCKGCGIPVIQGLIADLPKEQE